MIFVSEKSWVFLVALLKTRRTISISIPEKPLVFFSSEWAAHANRLGFTMMFGRPRGDLDDGTDEPGLSMAMRSVQRIKSKERITQSHRNY